MPAGAEILLDHAALAENTVLLDAHADLADRNVNSEKLHSEPSAQDDCDYDCG